LIPARNTDQRISTARTAPIIAQLRIIKMSLGKEIDKLIEEYRLEGIEQLKEKRLSPDGGLKPGLFIKRRLELMEKVGDLLEEYKF